MERGQNGIYLLGPFKSGDQVAIFVVEGQVGQVAYLIEGSQKELFVPAHFDIGMLEDAVMLVEFLQFVKGLVGGHHDLDVLEFLKVRQDRFRLMLAMITVGTEEHDHGLAVLPDIVLGQVGCAIELQQVEGWNCGEAEVWGLVGDRGCLLGRRLLGR